MKNKSKLSVHYFFVLLFTLTFTSFAQAGSFYITSTQSIESGIRVEFSLTIPEVQRINIYRHDKEDGLIEHQDDWTMVQAQINPGTSSGQFFFIDNSLELGHEYCYKLEIDLNSGAPPIETWPKCDFFDADIDIQRPANPTGLGIVDFNSNSLSLRFSDKSDNETYFFLEIEAPIFPNDQNPEPNWRVIGINQASPGSESSVFMDALDLEMEQNYCFRVRAVNSSGSSLSNVVCGKTSPIDLIPFTLFNNKTIVPKSLTHPSVNTLEFSWYDTFRGHRARVITLYEIDNLERIVNSKIYGVNTNTPAPSTHSVLFTDLDPEKIYCVNVDSLVLPFNPYQCICESPFGERTSIVDKGPIIPTIRRIVGSSGQLKLELKNPMQDQLIDMTRKDNGHRTTLRGVRDGRGSINLTLPENTEFLFRTFRTNKFGTRYGPSMSATVPNVPDGFPPGGSSGGSGSGGGVVHPSYQSGVDCNCNLTGDFIDPLPQNSGSTSDDGIYRVVKTSNSVSVFRVSDNVRVFNETNLNNGFQSGFGPRSRYFLLAEPYDVNKVSVGVHDLKGPSSDNRPFFEPNVIGSGGWGFSPDGRTFMIETSVTQSNVALNLTNLDKRESRTIIFPSPFSSFQQFSPCGDAFIVVNQSNASQSGNLNLYATEDLNEIVHNLSLNSDYSGISTNNTNHVVNNTSGSPQVISANSAQQSCQIPIRDGDTYDLQLARFPNASISTQEADQLFIDASNLLQSSNGAGDFACDVTFNRVGEIINISSGDGSIDTPSELNEALLAPGQVKVVDRINFCEDFVPDIHGCADLPGRSFVMVRNPLEVSTFAHEFGHNRGLQHVLNDESSLMYEYASPEAVNISEQECNAFLGISTSFFNKDQSMENTVLPVVSIEDFAHRFYYEGIPYTEAHVYGSQAVPKLLEMLKNPDEKRYWRNIVVILGMIGDEKAIGPMISFIEMSTKNITRDHYIAKTNAIMSLGYILNNTKNKRVLAYLTKSLSPNEWPLRIKQGITGYNNLSGEEINMDFSKYALLALAIAGTPESRKALLSLHSSSKSTSDTLFRIEYSELLRTALEENKKILEHGLQRYYSKRKSAAY